MKWLLSLLLLLTACTAQNSRTQETQALTDDNFWNYFVSTWQDPAYHGYLKFSVEVVDGELGSGILHPNSFKFHADHLRTLPAYQGLSAAQFDAITLYDQGRRLLLGTMLIPKSVEDYGHPNRVDVQLMGKDPLQPELVASVFKILQNTLPAEQFYLPVAEQLNFVSQESARFQKLGIRLAQPSQSLERVCYNSGWGVGHVRIVKAGELDKLLAEGAITAQDILVMDDVPRELPVVAGIVVSQTSSPASHPALLAGMLGIPFVYEKDATSLASWNDYAAKGELIFFQAAGDGSGCQFLVRPGDAGLLPLKKPLPLQLEDFDHSSQAPLNLDQLSRIDANRVGAKAANVAELRRLIPDHTVTEGLALPVGLFEKALQNAQTADGKSLRTALDAELQILLNPSVSSKETAEGLLRVRTLIENARLTAAAQSEILAAISAVFPNGTKIKLRSSSNIEDHPEFNGAGLYESKGACVGDDTNTSSVGLCAAKKDTVIKNLQKVWASLYSLKAWVARRYYGVDEQRSGMGVLVQRSYKGELANGVAISRYPESYDPSGEVSIEVQSTGFPGEDLEVANPPAGKVPETTLITAWGIEQQVASTEVARGRMLLPEPMYRQLYEQMAIVHAHYKNALNPKDASQFKLDMEWKLIEVLGVQKIVIKQVRPVPMKISSTQGLDRGTLVLGEKSARLCPVPAEFGKALSKLELSVPLTLAMDLHELPLLDAASIKNPIRSLATTTGPLNLGVDAAVQYTAWDAVWGSQNERRQVTVQVPLELNGKTYQLQWSARQERSLAQPRLLLSNVQTIWATDMRISAGELDFLDYQVVLGDAACESDAWQGFLPGSFQAASPYAATRKAPREYSEVYASTDGRGYRIEVKGRTGFQGFDKTRFMQIDTTVIEGLGQGPVTLDQPFQAVYAPGHHNFSYEFAFKLGKTRLLLRSIESWEEPLAELISVDEKGQETVLGSLKQSSRTDLYSGW